MFQIKLGRKAAETARDINDAFRPGTTNERVAQRWFKKFRNGDDSLKDEDGCGRPTAVNNEHLKALIEADPRKTTGEVAVELEVDHSFRSAASFLLHPEQVVGEVVQIFLILD